MCKLQNAPHEELSLVPLYPLLPNKNFKTIKMSNETPQARGIQRHIWLIISSHWQNAKGEPSGQNCLSFFFQTLTTST